MSSRRRLAPEVVQTSAMDCGPACLSCLLEGHGIRASYGRLREACQTDLDGTSIDTLEEAAVALGLDAEQVMLPADHLLLPGAAALPAMVVVRQPSGLTHFVVVWRRHGRWLQVMDPATGRRWTPARRFLAELYIHRLEVPAAAWREWAAGEEAGAAYAARLTAIGLGRRRRRKLLAAARSEPGWQHLAAVDAAARMVQGIVDAGGLAAGRTAGSLMATLAERAAAEAGRREPEAVPDPYWSVRPAAGEREEEGLELRGAVLVRCRGRRAEPVREKLSPELAAAVSEPPSRPGRELWRLVRSSGRAALAALAGLMLVAAGGVVFEALLFRSFFDVGRDLGLTAQRFAGIGVLAAFLAAILLLEWPVARGVLRLGRQLEMRLRVAFLDKIPRLGDRYFRSRLTSDLAARCHNVHRLRLLPELGEGVGRTICELLLTTAGIVWLDPGALPLALAATGVALGLPLVALPWLAERDLREREHAAALSRFYLDALLGLVPLRTHGAARAVEREHENLLVEWVSARLGRERVVVALDLVLHPVLLGLVAWLLVDHLGRRDLTSGVLLLVFWSLNLFALGRLVALLVAHQYPSHRSIALRLLEPLGAPEEEPAEETTAGVPAAASTDTGAVAFRLDRVAVRVAGHGILEGIDLAVAAGEHLAIVGPSGAGKSSLVGIFLGWYRPAAGELTVDGRPLDAARLATLRRATAWVDPQVQLWNRPLLDNLIYGGDGAPEVGPVLRQAELLELLQELPDGLQTALGESGALVSGGEGQRVRLARAMLRRGVRLVILDEPFRGLARDQRRGLLARARKLWRGATLLAVTHDIEETLIFDRVLVVEDRRIVEDGRPTALAERPDSAYRRMLLAEREVRSALWADPGWRRLTVAGGRILEGPGGAG